MGKRCKKCCTEKPEYEFYKAKRTRDGLTDWCKPCNNEAAKISMRKNRLRKRGIDFYEHEEMLAAQGHRCAICGTDEPRGYGWHLDHDHDTAVNRGILCPNCNVGLGHFKDDPTLLIRAVLYLYPSWKAKEILRE